jgi:hypothetical protein
MTSHLETVVMIFCCVLVALIPHTVFSLKVWSGVCMCKQPFTPPFSATDQPGAPLYLGTTYNLLANLVAQIRNAHPAPSIYGEDGMGR